jgi:hypothetical protein
MKLTPTLFLSVLTVACVLAEQQQQADGQDHHPEHQHILENSVADIVPAQPVAPETNQPSSTDDRLDIDYYRIPAIGVHEDFYTSPKFSIEISDIIPASLAAGPGKQVIIIGRNTYK